MTIRSIGYILVLATAATFSTSALAAEAKLTCVETESHESRTNREYNGNDADGILKNAKALNKKQCFYFFAASKQI